MNSEKKNLRRISLFLILLVVGLMAVNGCKKSEPEPTTPVALKTENAVDAAAETTKDAKEAVDKVVSTDEQTVCPIMGQPVNKELYTEYKGKKVYFCCAGCEEKFKQAPEQYLAKLPQFREE